jgi:hypothetical protein
MCFDISVDKRACRFDFSVPDPRSPLLIQRSPFQFQRGRIGRRC